MSGPRWGSRATSAAVPATFGNIARNRSSNVAGPTRSASGTISLSSITLDYARRGHPVHARVRRSRPAPAERPTEAGEGRAGRGDDALIRAGAIPGVHAGCERRVVRIGDALYLA